MRRITAVFSAVLLAALLSAGGTAASASTVDAPTPESEVASVPLSLVGGGMQIFIKTPTGAVLDPVSGALTGTPTTAEPWSFTITADSAGVMVAQTFSGTIAPQLAATGVDASALVGIAALLLLVGVALRVSVSARRASIRRR